MGEWIGARLKGGELFELIGDVGAGKTTFTRGLAAGMEVNERLQSPTFTVSREYEARDGLRLVHYDFYRLTEAGIMEDEIYETTQDRNAVVVVEWSGVVAGVMPRDRVTLTMRPVADDEHAREVIYEAEGDAAALIEEYVRVLAA